MGLFSGIFGGGKTVVTQAAANTTNVEVGVGIENTIDMTGIERVLEWLGLKTVELQEGQLAATVESGSLMERLLAEQTKENQQQQRAIADVLPWTKAVMAAVILALGVFAWKNWKGRK